MNSRPRGASLAFSFALLVAATLSACPPSESYEELGLSDSTFVHTLVRLRRIAEDTLLDSLARDSLRRVVLREQMVTAAQLDSAARLLKQQPKRAEAVWRTIDLEVARRQKATP